VVQDLLFLGFREIIAREDLFSGVVPSFAVRQIGGIKNLIFAEKSDFVNQHLVIGFAGEKDSARANVILDGFFAEF